jgi:putative membrane protein
VPNAISSLDVVFGSVNHSAEVLVSATTLTVHNYSFAMSNADQTPNLPNPGTELAKERNRAAEERTLMAWIRTALSLIGFGFGIDRIVAAIDRSLGGAVNPIRLTRILGLAFVALGTFAMLYAAIDHRQQLQRIQRNDLVYVHRHSPSLVVAYVLALLGTVAFVGMLISPLLR